MNGAVMKSGHAAIMEKVGQYSISHLYNGVTVVQLS